MYHLISEHQRCNTNSYQLDVEKTISLFQIKPQQSYPCVMETVQIWETDSRNLRYFYTRKVEKSHEMYAREISSVQISLAEGVMAYIIEGGKFSQFPYGNFSSQKEKGYFGANASKLSHENTYLFVSSSSEKSLSPKEIWGHKFSEVILEGESLYMAKEVDKAVLGVDDKLVKIHSAIFVKDDTPIIL